MQGKKRNGNFVRRALLAVITAGTVFQASSCSIGGDGVINAFADPAAFVELHNQLLDASPLGRIFRHFDE